VRYRSPYADRKALQVRRPVPHDLRRTAARSLRALGMSDRDIAAACGWETIAMAAATWAGTRRALLSGGSRRRARVLTS